MKQLFVDRKFSRSSLDIIDKANDIIGEYLTQGYRLTVRQLYYQFVSRDFIPNNIQSYKRLSSIVNDARLAGHIDWEAIEDRTREVTFVNAWTDPRQVLNVYGRAYKEDLWDDQPFKPEVWVEKEALIGVFERICRELRVPYFACRGYTSQTLAYEAGVRAKEHIDNGYKPIILHFGDHDPSGIDMTRDNASRVSMFAGASVQVRRLALNMDQIETYAPPPNPAKETDARFTEYRRKYGDESWELDALEPRVLSELVRSEVGALRDDRLWVLAKKRETINRDLLVAAGERWDEVEELLTDDG